MRNVGSAVLDIAPLQRIRGIARHRNHPCTGRAEPRHVAADRDESSIGGPSADVFIGASACDEIFVSSSRRGLNRGLRQSSMAVCTVV
jgi:hypothetical protein